MTEQDQGDDAPIDVSKLEGWDEDLAPEGFAERVVDTWLDQDAVPDRPPARRWPWVAAAAAIVVAAGAAWAVSSLRLPDPMHGELVAQARQTVDLASAVAVAEVGAHMQWDVATSGTRIDQQAGEVFYRVDPGTDFEVATPGGTVQVTGTCFSVEIEPMKNPALIKGLVTGAALAAAVTVTVYEGQVVLADEGHSVVVRPGQQAVSASGKVSVSDGDDGEKQAHDRGSNPAGAWGGDSSRTIDRLRADAEAQQTEIAALKRQVEELGGSTEEISASQVQRCASSNRETPGCSFVDPDQEVLLEMARCAKVRADVPWFVFAEEFPPGALEQQARAAGLGDGEWQKLDEAGRQFRDDFNTALDEIALDAGADPEIVAAIPKESLRGVIEGLLDNHEMGEARRSVSRERAGLQDPPAPGAELSVAERYIRLNVDVGSAFENRVGKALGPERAHELRHANDGWPGGTSVWSGECEDE